MQRVSNFLKKTPDGVFTDKLSGVALFDTRDRFNSGTGWLSFTKPVNGKREQNTLIPVFGNGQN
ncbi:MAG: hypothetical protein Ct9H300mP3_09240 [Gammaproteobacteria bacterium]|nr:MAG: hypothetical protein Ct9H300mP3_09240 [Gammaproteobacteria bacterium]